MEKLRMDLQMFAEEETEEVEIPAELEGVSEETAREIMKEIPQEETEEEETPTEEKAQEEESAPAEADGDNKGKIPYERFKEVNDKYRQSEQQLVELRRQVEELKQTPTTQQTQQDEPTKAAPKQQPIVPMDLLQKAYDIAKNQVIESLNMTAEEYDDLEYQDEESRAEIDRAIKFQYDSICQQARERAAQLAQEAQMKQAALGQAYQDYYTTAEKEQQRDDFNDIWEYATTTHWSQLPIYQQAVIQNAFTAVNAGQGTLEQIQLVQDYYRTAKNAYLSQDKSSSGQKVKQMANAPRVDKVRGVPSIGGMTMAEMERMLNETPWEDIPKEVQHQLLSGRLR